LFKIFANAWRVEDIRKKLLFILLLLFIYRIGAILVPLPGMDFFALDAARYGGGGGDAAMTFFMLLMGGELGMQKEGEDGRKKIQQITRYLAVILAALQGAATVFSYTNWPPGMGGFNLFRPEAQNIFVYAMATIAMMTGTIFIMWLAELLTEKGIGNGASFLIFANILAALPGGAMTLWMLATGEAATAWIQAGLILIVFVIIIAFVVWVHEGERRIPVQYSRKAAGGRASYGNQFFFYSNKSQHCWRYVYNFCYIIIAVSAAIIGLLPC
jgi:preprotein translocase subunit SecY